VECGRWGQRRLVEAPYLSLYLSISLSIYIYYYYYLFSVRKESNHKHDHEYHDDADNLILKKISYVPLLC